MLAPNASVVADAEVAKFSERSNGTTLVYDGVRAFKIGEILIIGTNVYKVVTYRAEGPTTFVETVVPQLEEIFSTLQVSTDLVLTEATFVPEPGTTASATPAEGVAYRQGQAIVPDISLSRDVPLSGGAQVNLAGKLKNAVATLNIDRRDGAYLRREISLRGTMEASAKFQVAGASSDKPFKIKLGEWRIPIPTALGPLTRNILAIKIPVALVVTAESKVKFTLAEVKGTTDFTVGGAYDETARKFINLSSVSPSYDVVPPEKADVAQALWPLMALGLSQTTDLVKVSVAPQFEPALSAFNDKVGSIGVRGTIGLAGKIGFDGKFPSLLDCARFKASLTSDVFAFLNYKVYESLLDFEGDTRTAEAKLFSAEATLKEVSFGECPFNLDGTWTGTVTDAGLTSNPSGQCRVVATPGTSWTAVFRTRSKDEFEWLVASTSQIDIVLTRDTVDRLKFTGLANSDLAPPGQYQPRPQNTVVGQFPEDYSRFTVTVNILKADGCAGWFTVELKRP